MCRMLVALGNVNILPLIEGLKHMAKNGSKVTSHMVKNLTDEELKKVFETKQPYHDDGWGIAYQDNNQFQIKKSLKPVFEDNTEEFNKIKNNFVLLHARFKTVGEKKLENTQPYQHNEFVFCHNGTIKKEIIYNKDKFKLKGNTDSEQLFYSILSKELPIKEAIKKTFDEIELKPNSNIILSNKEKTYIYSSYRTIPDYIQMYVGKGENLLVISSEILPQLNITWKKLPFEKVIEINNNTLEIIQH